MLKCLAFSRRGHKAQQTRRTQHRAASSPCWAGRGETTQHTPSGTGASLSGGKQRHGEADRRVSTRHTHRHTVPTVQAQEAAEKNSPSHPPPRLTRKGSCVSSECSRAHMRLQTHALLLSTTAAPRNACRPAAPPGCLSKPPLRRRVLPAVKRTRFKACG